jgi:hypothetical protein
VLIELLVELLLGLVEELRLVLALETEQLRLASALSVLAPWPRLRARVELTVDGRAATWLWNDAAAPRAVPHCPAVTAEETELSRALRSAACWLESRPAPLPQATTKATANPRLPARNARGFRLIGA